VVELKTKGLLNGLNGSERSGVFVPYKGIVKGNVVVLEGGVKLPDGLPVFVEPVRGDRRPDFEKDPFLSVDEWAPESPDDAPADLAHRHDCYLYEADER
jgi:hypothetical protein